MKSKSLLIHISVLLFLSNLTFAQLQTYKKGLASFEKGQYDLAIKDLTKVTEIATTEKPNLYLKIAEAYRLTNRWIESIPFYEKAIEAGSALPEIHFHYAFAQKAAGKYDIALKELETFLAAKSNIKAFNDKALRELNNLRVLNDIKQNQKPIEFKNLAQINTSGAEFSPIILNDELIFTASRKSKLYANGLPYLGLYKAKLINGLTQLGKIEKFSEAIFDEERNEGTPAFSPDGKTMIFARGNTGKRKDRSPDVDLYISRLVDGSGWSEPAYVSASDSASWDGSPAFSRDGKTIYFASKRAGGMGGIDLYRVNMDASGRFGTPTNLGKEINTAGDEMFPFVNEDGKLFFASDGHAGLGKLDIFQAIRSAGKITVENMGLPYNSTLDDFGLIFDKKGNQFFSSNRAGGAGDDDIYFYEMPVKEEIAQNNTEPLTPKQSTEEEIAKQTAIKKVNYFLAGTIYGKDNQTTTLLDSAVVRILDADNADTVATLQTNKNGVFPPVQLQEEKDYVVFAERKGYLAKREDFSMTNRIIPQSLLKKVVTDTTFYTSLTLDKIFVGITFKVENIYYDLDKWNIRADAAVELDKLVQILNDNPAIKIELGSHTDSRATDAYNFKLSQRRAESVINYLVSKGISAERLEAKGYGESELIIKNAKTEEEHQVNRRTEFKVIEIGGK